MVNGSSIVARVSISCNPENRSAATQAISLFSLLFTKTSQPCTPGRKVCSAVCSCHGRENTTESRSRRRAKPDRLQHGRLTHRRPPPPDGSANQRQSLCLGAKVVECRKSTSRVYCGRRRQAHWRYHLYGYPENPCGHLQVMPAGQTERRIFRLHSFAHPYFGNGHIPFPSIVQTRTADERLRNGADHVWRSRAKICDGIVPRPSIRISLCVTCIIA